MTVLSAHLDSLDHAAAQAGTIARDLSAASAPEPPTSVLPQARNFIDALATAHSAHSAAIARLGDYFFEAQLGIEQLSRTLLDHDASHAAAFGG